MRAIITIVLALLMMLSLANAQNLTNVDFSVRDINGDDQSFQEYLETVRGSEDNPKKGVVFISFWALWCKPCKQEMKALVDIYEKYKDKNFHYLAINTDKPKSIAKVKAYVKSQKLPYDFWLDPNSKVFKKLNGQSQPYALMIDENGKLLKKSVGFIAGDEAEVEKSLKKYLE
jgi:thiol-disulfide isomerase/thioredoxin